MDIVDLDQIPYIVLEGNIVPLHEDESLGKKYILYGVYFYVESIEHSSGIYKIHLRGSGESNNHTLNCKPLTYHTF